MERFQEARDKALKHLKAADHMLNVTYPLIQDSKLLLGVVESIFLCATNAMGAILWYDRLFKNVPPFYDTFESKFNMFRSRCVQTYHINKGVIDMIQEVKDIIVQHKQSQVEFRKKDRFIICAEDYTMTAVTDYKIKDYLKKAKELVAAMTIIIGEHERIFRGSKGRTEAG